MGSKWIFSLHLRNKIVRKAQRLLHSDMQMCMASMNQGCACRAVIVTATSSFDSLVVINSLILAAYDIAGSADL